VIYILILLAHVIGDFTFQFKGLAKAKDKNVKYLLVHLVIYMIPMTLVLMLYGNIGTFIMCFFIIMISHFIIDFLKSKLSKKYFNAFSHNLFFIIDQGLHVLILLAIAYWGLKENDYNWFTRDFISFLGNNGDYYLAIILSILICLSPTSILIKHILTYVDVEINTNLKAKLEESLLKELDNNEKKKIEDQIKDLNDQLDNWNVDSNSNKIGSLIGKLERIVILILAIMNLYASIGLVFTAKSLARFKQLEDKDFAEKYLVGTLCSFLVTLILVYFVNYFK
jgi:hypothetical protein